MSALQSAIVPRQVHFDWSRAPLHWIRDDPFASHWANGLSDLLTQGEKLFCRGFRETLPLVQDLQRRADVQVFIKQDAVHSLAHRASIEAYLKRLGIAGGGVHRVARRLASGQRAEAFGHGRGEPSVCDAECRCHRHSIASVPLSAGCLTRI